MGKHVSTAKKKQRNALDPHLKTSQYPTHMETMIAVVLVKIA